METKTGDAVVFVDSESRIRPALVTHVWLGAGGSREFCGTNLVVVEDDPKREDSYGRQVRRETSVTHMAQQSAPGMYWRRTDEPGKPTERPL